MPDMQKAASWLARRFEELLGATAALTEEWALGSARRCDLCPCMHVWLVGRLVVWLNLAEGPC